MGDLLDEVVARMPQKEMDTPEANIASKLDQYCANAGWTGSNLYDGAGYLLMAG